MAFTFVCISRGVELTFVHLNAQQTNSISKVDHEADLYIFASDECPVVLENTCRILSLFYRHLFLISRPLLKANEAVGVFFDVL